MKDMLFSQQVVYTMLSHDERTYGRIMDHLKIT
jgi:hypothetical protein